MRGHPGRHEGHQVEPEPLARGLRRSQVSEVNGVERAPQQPDPHALASSAPG